ncbi:hypothetical protein ACLOJK_019000 [Asimina triloba]
MASSSPIVQHSDNVPPASPHRGSGRQRPRQYPITSNVQAADPCANPSFITATDHSIVNRRPICKHGSNVSSPNHEHIHEQPGSIAISNHGQRHSSRPPCPIQTRQHPPAPSVISCRRQQASKNRRLPRSDSVCPFRPSQQHRTAASARHAQIQPSSSLFHELANPPPFPKSILDLASMVTRAPSHGTHLSTLHQPEPASSPQIPVGNRMSTFDFSVLDTTSWTGNFEQKTQLSANSLLASAPIWLGQITAAVAENPHEVKIQIFCIRFPRDYEVEDYK